MIVVFAAGALAAPFAQYYFGPRLAALSGIAELSGGATGAPDLTRLRALEQQAALLSQRTDSLSRAAGGSARVDVLENELALLRRKIGGLTTLTDRTTALEENTETLRALESRLATLETVPPPTDVSGEVAALDERIASVAATLAAVRDQGSQLALAIEALQIKLTEDLEHAATLHEARMTALEQSRGDVQLGAEVENLRERTGALEAALGESAARSALVVALGNLRAAAERGRPFDVELQAVRSLVVSFAVPQLDAPLDVLAASAGTGLPTIVRLERAFLVLANSAAQGRATAGEDWVGRTLIRVSSLVTVRRTGNIAGASPEAVVARAELHLGAGQLDAAVAEMTKLRGQSAQVDQWLERADRRLAGERALDEIGALVLAVGGVG